MRPPRQDTNVANAARLVALFKERRHVFIAWLSSTAIVLHLIQRFVLHQSPPATLYPLWAALLLGGAPLVVELARKALRGQFGSDLLAGMSIVTAVLLEEYLAGTLVVLMLSGGNAIESYAVRSASSVLDALVKRMPTVAHRKSNGGLADVSLSEVMIGDLLLIMPHETCPVDGVVVEGHGSMDEAYLTGEPYQMSKSVGSDVLSGAINGESAPSIRASRLAADSRYAKIMQVMQDSQQRRPRLRRLGDRLGALYTPVAVGIAVIAWAMSGNPVRFLAVLVVATPCPLLIAIPVAIIGSISLAARRGIIIRDPAMLERISGCRTIIFDKTGTLTYGEPRLTDQVTAPGADARDVLGLVASVEQYSKHPLAPAILDAARQAQVRLREAAEVREPPGRGLAAVIDGHRIQITSRKQFIAEQPSAVSLLPPTAGGLECIALVDGVYAATLRFRDEPRAEGASFVRHLAPKHRFDKLMLVSGDRESEARYLAERVGIQEVYAGKSPEEKLQIVRDETAQGQTLYVGDGINDAPALLAATVGVALGQKSEVTTEAAGAVIMDNSLQKVDELLHIGHRLHRIALQSAVGGMALSIIGMMFAAAGYLPPVTGAILQEVIDLLAVLNALRVAVPPRQLFDY